MVISDMGKLIGLALITVGLFVLVGIGRVEWDAALPIFTLEVGYLTGNGVSAVRRSAPSPVLMPSLQPGTMATIHGPVQADVTDGWSDQQLADGGGQQPTQQFHDYNTDQDGNL